MVRAGSLPRLRRLLASKVDAPSIGAVSVLASNSALRELDLSKTDLQDEQAAALSGLCSLDTLFLSYTRISDRLFMLAPALFARVVRLKLTGLEGLSDAGVDTLSAVARRVEVLDLGSRRLTDQALGPLANMETLRELRIWDTKISEQAANMFCTTHRFQVSQDMKSSKGTYILLKITL